jgi:hypothetical protein
MWAGSNAVGLIGLVLNVYMCMTWSDRISYLLLLSLPALRSAVAVAAAAPWPRRPLLVLAPLLLLLLEAGPLQAQRRADGFGSWQRAAQTCRRNLAGDQPAGCLSVQLSQQQEGVLSVRFIARGSKPDSANQLTFAGALVAGATPLACNGGRCTPKGPLRTVLTSVSEASFDERGLAQGLPSAWPAEGSCQLEASSVRCEARALSGETWAAQATF